MRRVFSVIFYLVGLCLLASCAEDSVEPGFTVTTGEMIRLSGEAGAQDTIRFTSTREWEASAGSDWVTLSPTSGEAGTCEVILTAGANESDSTRTTTVVLTSASLAKAFIVEQLAGDYLQLESDTFRVTAEGGNLLIRFTTNVDDSALKIYGSGSDWLTQQMTKASSSYVVALTVLPNMTGRSRTAEILFYKESVGERLLLAQASIIQASQEIAVSTDFSADKQVRQLHQATIGEGLPIVIMGDGFLDTAIADGTYDQVMDKAMENLFSEEPLNSLRDYFDVYAVTAVSLNEEFGNGYETALGCALEGGSSTGISGDEEAVFSYVKCVEGVDEEDVLAVVILNTPTYAGTTYYGYYSSSSGMAECAIAYCPVVGGLDNELFRQVLVHEAVGHGFGKLMDEYSYESNGTIPDSEKAQIQYLQTLSWARNVDFTPKETDVLWASFLTDERYASQGLGVFEGACTYVSGAYRPSEESMMNSNILGFNAPSRQAIYDMVMRRALGKEPTYEEFVEFDQRTFSSTVQGQVRSSSAVSSVGRLASPRFVGRPLVS